MKKLMLLLSLVLMVAVSPVVLADTSSDETIEELTVDEGYEYPEQANPVKRHRLILFAEHIINKLMDIFNLTEENTIGDLLGALNDENDKIKEEAVDHFGVESTSEIRDAFREHRADRIRENLGLSDDLTDAEVFAEARAQKESEVKELLGLNEDATSEEVEQAYEEWRKDNNVLLKDVTRHKIKATF